MVSKALNCTKLKHTIAGMTTSDLVQAGLAETTTAWDASARAEITVTSIKLEEVLPVIPLALLCAFFDFFDTHSTWS